MKLTQKDLDQEILDKLNRLDPVIGKFSTEDLSSFIGYNGTEFYLKKINDINLRKIISSSEINRFRDFFFKETPSIKNSFDSNFNLNNRPNKALKTQIVELSGIPLFKIDNEIRNAKKERDYVLLLDTKGIIYKYNFIAKKLEFSLDIVKKVRTLFAVAQFETYDILDFEIFRGGFLVSTTNNGVYFADVLNNNLEVLYSENNIKTVKAYEDKKVLLISDRGQIIIYDFDTKMKLETFNQMKRLDQEPRKIIADREKIVILGKSRFNNSNEKLLHILKKDLAGVSFENISSKIFPGVDNQRYTPLFLSEDERSIYISGLRDGKFLFVWKYNIEKLEDKFEEIVIKDIEFDSLDYVRIYGGEILVSYKNRILVFNLQGKVQKNLVLREMDYVKDIFTENEERKFLVISKDSVVLFKFPEYLQESTFSASIYNGAPVNSIEVLVSSKTGKENIVLIDGETSAQIIPTFYLVHEGNSYIRYFGTIRNVSLKIDLLEDSEIERIVVNAEKVYLK